MILKPFGNWWRRGRAATLPLSRDDQPILLELFNLEQLQQHAEALAAKHEIGPAGGHDLLLPRLAENERVLRDAYEQLSAAVRAKRGISPAGEWLLDNFHLIEEQIGAVQRHLPRGYSLELPRLRPTGAATSGVPRVYDIALAVIAHVDGRVDRENITTFVAAYQQVTPLRLGEFWAIPIMLRLALIENLRRVAARVVVGMGDRDQAVHWTERMLQTAESDPKNLILAVADMARSNPPMSNAYVAELVRNLQGHRPILDIPLTWLEQQLAVLGRTTQQTVQMEGQQQAANQVSVSASIGSLRFLGAMDWREFVELSFVDQELRRDPAGIYEHMDFATRDYYRHVVEHLAKRSALSEWKIAGEAVALAEQHAPTGKEGHVGYYLAGRGRGTLEDLVLPPARVPWHRERYGQEGRRWLYLGAICLCSTALTVGILSPLAGAGLSAFIWILLTCATLTCASQIGIGFVNRIVTAFKAPHLLPRLDFSGGIPPACRTLVVVPSMLVTPANVESLLDGLEVRYLANREQNLHFALVTDLADASLASMPTDQGLTQAAADGIHALNARYAPASGDIFFLMHRDRIWNEKEHAWMGYERKRGKLEALNALLRAPPGHEQAAKAAFARIAGDVSILTSVKYVITLDTDTQLPRDAAQKLIGTMAHPLNQPQFGGGAHPVVTGGYSILQPRVAVSLPGAMRSWFVRLYAGDPGIDPYTRAVSDVYQDLFHEGSFIGKGIYDVDAFTRALAGRLPENLILSHDLLEGCYARCGLVSDVLLYEEHPSHFAEDANRRRRWIRGDWQILFWLLPRVPGADGIWRKNPLSWLSRWKIFDNLRRSLVPVAMLTLLAAGWLEPTFVPYMSCVVLGLLLLPSLSISLLELMRKPPEATVNSHLRRTGQQALLRLAASALGVVFLLFDVVTSLDAIGTTLLRVFVTHKNLLAWRSATDPRHSAAGGLGPFYRFMISVPLLALALGAVLVWQRPQALPWALPLLAMWAVSPAIASRLSRIITPKTSSLSSAELDELRNLARKTWRFFETFVGPEDHFLPPDNFQEYPAPVVAHRTSPTNIGLSLLANLSAYDFGYLSAAALLERTTQTFGTLESLERYKGHFYNWYDTKTLKPLPPLYVSTVDSGNLSGLLLTLRPGLKELADHKIIPPSIWPGLSDTLAMLAGGKRLAATTSATLALLLRDLKDPPATLRATRELQGRLKQTIADLKDAASEASDGDANWWLTALTKQCGDGIEDGLATLAPWSYLSQHTDAVRDPRLFALDAIPTLRDVAELGSVQIPVLDVLIGEHAAGSASFKWLQELRPLVEQASRNAAERMAAISKLAQRCEDLSIVDYEFLYDRSRHLLAIGYNVTEHRRDNGFYDLLASEARLGSFVAIAQGHLPQEHWFALGRLLTAWKGEPTLLSWSGSMFEYLMPLLVMPTLKNTLLGQTHETSVKRQIEYGKQRGVPWGISESGYNATDAQLNYQYRAFGVPGLGLKRGLADDLVIAPYASVMALMVAPAEALANLQRMKELGFEGRYGFYEAVDYTPVRLDADQTHVIIRSFMAHHQGMSFLSLAYHLLDRKMQKRFQSDPLFKATELLLHERVPKSMILFPHAPEVSEAARLVGGRELALQVIKSPNTPRPEIHLLSNGRYTVMLTNSGGGYSRWQNLAVTRWREDPTCDNWGTFCYVRDVDNGAVWSVAHQPTLKQSSHYEAIFPLAKAEFRRRDHDLEIHTEITVSPEDDIELRRFSMTNLSTQRRTIELTSYGEVVLAPPAADEAHPAFSNLFVQTEIIAAKQAILCSRRPRSDAEHSPTMLHLMTVHGSTVGDASYETDRSHFIGRGRSVTDPAAMAVGSQLGGHEGSVLDPIVAIRCRIVIEPEQTVRVHIVTGIGKTRAAALDLAETYRDRHTADRVFELARTHSQVALRQANMTEVDAQLYGRLASSVIYANPLRRASASLLNKNRRGQSGLWSHGISGDLPIVLLRVANAETSDIVRQLVQAHSYWRRLGLAVDLVIWNEDDSGYRQDVNDRILSVITAGNAREHLDRPGGIFVRRIEQLSEEDRVLLQTVARAVLSDSGGTLSEQIDRRSRSQAPVPLLVPERARDEDSGPSDAANLARRDGLFANAFGDFSPDGREYRITTSANAVTPAPWVNVIANPYFGTVVSESGSAYTWCENAHEFRLTPWNNDAVCDPSGECFYVRDEESGAYWSPTPLPARGAAPYVTTHGFGYSMFQHTNAGIKTEMTTFVAIDAPIKIILIKLRNMSGRGRRLSVTGYCEWALGELRAKSLMHVTTEIDPTNAAIFARNPYHTELGGRVAFFDLSEKTRTVTGDRSEFIGRNGNAAAPAALQRQQLSGRVGAALDACAAMQAQLELGDGQEYELVFVLGVGRDEEDARTLIRRFGVTAKANLALREVKEFWDQTLGAVQIKTPDPAVDVLANGWLTYQTLACRMWARSGFYQSGGAFGFRDQLQDAMALLHTKPRLLREHLLRCAAHQFREGDVQHWWHPPSGLGVRTHFSDDYLWLPLATARYVLGLGDLGVLDVKVEFIEGRQLKPEEEAYGDFARTSEESATLYEHCVLAINRSLRFGVHGLPLMGCGDWNDGMNLVGQQGKGESVWLAFFLFDVLKQFAKVARRHGDAPFAETCASQAEKLRANIESHGWDGEWYRRAYFDGGQALGSSSNDECQIDSIPQSWAVLSGAADAQRSRQGMAAVDRRLVDREHLLIKLFDPPFDKSQPNPGYIKGYVPGVRENGGQYTHAAIWSAMAFAALGDRERAWEVLTMINPLSHTGASGGVETYKVEPYVMAADVYAVPPHAGRGGWTWYTGSAGWMYRLIVESLLGLRLEIDRLYFTPCVPEQWPGFQIKYQYRSTVYDISLRPAQESCERGRIKLDGDVYAGDGLRLVDDLAVHEVEVCY